MTHKDSVNNNARKYRKDKYVPHPRIKVNKLKLCRGCGGEKNNPTPRTHFCLECDKDVNHRVLILSSRCSKGHFYSDVGYKISGKKIRCNKCVHDLGKLKWADPITRKKNIIARRRAKLYREFGLTEEGWMVMYAYQNGKCAICQSPLNLPFEKSEGKRDAAVDHNHITGMIRGLLCRFPCNYALGHFHDNLENLRASISYLETPPSVAAFGKEIYTLPGKIGTKKRRKQITEYLKSIEQRRPK